VKRWISNILLVFFALLFLVSGYYLVEYVIASRQAQSEYNDLAALVEKGMQNKPSVPQKNPGTTSDGDPAVEDSPTEPTAPVLTQVEDPETGDMIDILPEYAELYLMNPDLVGWICLEGTDINYPVMHHPEDKDYYLRKNFYHEYSSRGCIYLREVCSLEPHTDNVTIYGHNMSDGTMFAVLHGYRDQKFWEEHKTITLNSLTEYRTYEIMAVFPIESSLDSEFQYHLFVNALTEAEFDEYVDNCKALSLYDTGVEAEYGDKLITFSTCYRIQHNGRLVVVCKLVDDSL